MRRRHDIRPVATEPGRRESDMIARFEELDWQETPKGELTLRRRADPATDELIYEVKLKDDYLMSSLFTRAEEERAQQGRADAEAPDLDVLVGGLGLGYTAVTALHHGDRKRVGGGK